MESLIEMSNQNQEKKLEIMKRQLMELEPTKFAQEEFSYSLEDYIKSLQTACDIYKVKEIANQYGVLILEGNAYFLAHLQSFDKRDVDLQNEGEKIEKEHFEQSKKRLKTLKIIKLLHSKHSYISAKGLDKILLETEEYTTQIPLQLLNKLFQENKALYCDRCGWDEKTKDIVDFEDINSLINIEEREQLIYNSAIETDRMTAIEFKLLASLLHKAELFYELVEKEGYDFDPAIKLEFDNTWATTNKSCFMVDLFVFYNVIPSYYQDKTPQEKYQYIKAKLKQADTFISKV